MTDRESDSAEIEVDPAERSQPHDRSGEDADERADSGVDGQLDSDAEAGAGLDLDDESTWSSDAERLADELGRTSLRTTEDGYVEARVTALEERRDDTIELTVRLPTDQEVSFVLEKPIPWSEKYLFARIVDDAGYDAASVDHLVGETVLLDRITDDANATPLPDVNSPTQSRGLLRPLFEMALDTDATQEWRLVDPDERTEPQADDGRSASGRLLLATIAITLSLAGIVLGSIYAVAALNLSALIVSLLAFASISLLAVVFVCYAGLVVLDRFT
jgi:hypothetical protein